jgi:ABC-type Zn uptake system ZnuABC Zn-binding protein ZnuA
MKKGFIITIFFQILVILLLASCQVNPGQTSTTTAGQGGLKVIAVESFLADIAQNVAGNRIKVDTLMPLGMDPHAFEPVPQDVAKIADSQIIIINGGGIEDWLQKVIKNAGGEHQVLEASAGLKSRDAREGESVENGTGASGQPANAAGDPHFWLDPISVIHYVENIRDGLAVADPAGKDIYTKNAETYIARLKALDASLQEQAKSIPPEKRLIVTNHESFGYFADRYGFKIIGTIIPSVSTGASPSAQQLARLVDHIKATGASAIFLETGTNPQIADQISKETGVKVVTDLYTHSITPPDGKAPTYIVMMKYNMTSIVENLK